jgi:hypothetical protein
VFGKVTEGMAVVDKIATVQTTRKGGHSDVPVAPIVIKKAKRLDAPSPPASLPEAKSTPVAKKQAKPGTLPEGSE